MIDKQTESLMLDYVLRHEGGIYYVYENRLDSVPDEFQSKKASRYLAAIELLARYGSAKDKLLFAYDWLKDNQQTDGTWDMGAASKDGSISRYPTVGIRQQELQTALIGSASCFLY